MRRGDAVAGIAHRIVNVAGPDPAERREVCWRNVDGPAPRILDGHLGEAREHEAEALGRLADGARVTRERVIDRPPRPPATPARPPRRRRCGRRAWSESSAAMCGGR